MDNLALALSSARIKNLQTEIKRLDFSLKDLQQQTAQLESRKEYLSTQLENTKLQIVYIKRLLS